MDKIRVLIAALGFSLGFGLMFFLISLPFIGLSLINSVKIFISYLGGIVLIMVGLILLDVLKIPLLSRYFKFVDYKVNQVDSKRGLLGIFLGSIFVGISFTAGWAPCVGPVMLGLLSLLSNQQNLLSAILLLLIMTTGLMTSFLLVSFIVIIFGNIISKLSKVSIFLERVMGVIFIILGLLIIFSKANIFLSLGLGTDLLEKMNYEITNFSLSTAVVSFIAGIFLFLSPCTLPLVIPYFFYLTGISIKK